MPAPAAAPDASAQDVLALDVLPPAVARSWLQQGQGPVATARRALSVPALWALQVARQPHAIAVIDSDTQLSCAQLDARARSLGMHLQARLGGELCSGQTVALLMGRSTALIVAELAVLQLGACYLPIAPDTPAARQAFMLQDSGACAVIVDGLQPSWDEADLAALPLIDVRHEADAIALCDASAQASTPVASDTLGPDSVACVMYTSGSTGQPKGVRVPHRGIARVTVDNGYLDIQPEDRLAHLSNPAFDAATFEVWGALLNGASLVVLDADTVLAPQALAQALLTHNVSIMFMTTALFGLHADALAPAFARMKAVLFGGETLDTAPVRRTWAHGRPQQLLHVYGPTETTTFATAHRITEADVAEAASRRIPIGRAIAATQVLVLDATMRPVPPGVVGEVYIGGAGVALGYLNRPALTASHFVPDPFQPHAAGALLYRTGDLGRWRTPGLLDHMGRNDQQVKLRGLRIEPGEIEARLMSWPGLHEGLVMLREDHPGDKRLVAYVTRAAASPQTDEAALFEALRAHLRATLPDYMVPTAWVLLDELPLTPNGKVDRRALPAPAAASAVTAADEAPQTDTELALAALWQALLHVAAVGRHQSFFDLGGHSLLAVQLAARVHRHPHRRLRGHPAPRVPGHTRHGHHTQRDRRPPPCPRRSARPRPALHCTAVAGPATPVVPQPAGR
jgi:amino acid adenylation domain-containing protein